MSFRVLGVGGFVLFTISALAIAAGHSGSALLLGLVLLGAFWLESSTNICRRCRYYGTWHCLGQGMLVSRILSPIRAATSEPGVMLHAALAAGYILYGLFWLWHRPALGVLFTVWAPLAFVSATTPSGFSWRAKQPS